MSKVEMSVTLRKLRNGENGIDGVGAYTLDLDNDNIAIGLVAVDGSLRPVSPYNSGRSGVYVAGGADNSASLSRLDLIDSQGNSLAYATASHSGSYSDASRGIASLTLSLTEVSVNDYTKPLKHFFTWRMAA